MKMLNPAKDQFSGCLIGQALGDALGFIVEEYSPQNCQKYIDHVLTDPPRTSFKRGPFPLGQYSDDTQLARELISSIVKCRAFDPKDYAERIANIFGENKIVGRGLATQEAAEKLLKGVPWHKSGAQFPSAGNGSAMRAAPIGLFYYGQPEKMVLAAIDQSRITHQDPRCLAGSVAIAGATALALQYQKLNPERFIDQLEIWTEPIDSTVGESIHALKDWLDLAPKEAVHYISNVGFQSGYLNEWDGISPYVISSVLWSLYSFLRSPNDYYESIKTAIAVGGDVDTTGAMTGAISGAFNGLSAIPESYVKLLTDQGTWGGRDLVDLSYKYYDLTMQLTKALR